MGFSLWRAQGAKSKYSAALTLGIDLEQTRAALTQIIGAAVDLRTDSPPTLAEKTLTTALTAAAWVVANLPRAALAASRFLVEQVGLDKADEWIDWVTGERDAFPLDPSLLMAEL